MHATYTTRHRSPLFVLLIVTVFSLVLVPIIVLWYGYNTMSIVASAVGFVILLAVLGFVSFMGRRVSQQENSERTNHAILIGLVLGLLWIIEISINNVLAPPLPARDLIDNGFWGIIALGIFVFALFSTYRTGHIRVGLVVGSWAGFVSGLLACAMGLAVVVFGMHLLTHDPLNVTEWAARGPHEAAPTMAAYFAYETFAGAFLHLIVLGVIMGALLGGIGGLIGKAIKRVLQ